MEVTEPRLNKQVERTRRWILDALLELLSHTSYEDIRIGALAETAGVSRQSFYRNFGTKDDVVAAYFDGIFEEFVRGSAQVAAAGPATTYATLFRTLRTHAEELRMFAQPSLRHVLFYALWGYQERLLQFVPRDVERTAEQVLYDEYLVKYQYGGVAALTMEWIEQGMQTDPDALGRVVARITEPFGDQGMFLPVLVRRLDGPAGAAR